MDQANLLSSTVNGLVESVAIFSGPAMHTALMVTEKPLEYCRAQEPDAIISIEALYSPDTKPIIQLFAIEVIRTLATALPKLLDVIPWVSKRDPQHNTGVGFAEHA